MCGNLLKSHGQPFHVPFGGSIDDDVPVDVVSEVSVEGVSVLLIQNEATAIPNPILSLSSTARVLTWDLAFGSSKTCSGEKKIRGMPKIY